MQPTQNDDERRNEIVPNGNDAPAEGHSKRREEIALVVGCLIGDRDAFHELVRQYSKLIHAMAAKVIGDSTRDVSMDAEDLTERFFLEVWQSPWPTLGRFDVSRGSLSTYLNLIAPPRFEKWVQAHAVAWPTRRPSHDTATLDHVAVRSADSFDPERLVNRLLSKLSDRSRTLVEARFGLRQESFEEARKRMGMSKTTAYRHVARVLRVLGPLAEEIDPQDDTPPPEPAIDNDGATE